MRANISSPLQETRLCGSKISVYLVIKKVCCYRLLEQPWDRRFQVLSKGQGNFSYNITGSLTKRDAIE